MNDLQRALDRVTKPPVLAVLAAVLAMGTAVIAVQYLASRQPLAIAGDAVGTGDFMAFYTGATLIAAGEGSSLYDYGVQADVQQALVGEVTPGMQGYLNPPLLAIGIAAIEPLGYLPAFYVFGAFSVALLALAAVALRRELPMLTGTPVAAFTTAALAIGFNPVIRSAVGGQNTAITLALLALVYAGLRRKNALLAGVALGLLTYKPQYAVVLGGLLLLRGEIPTLAVAAVIGAAHYGLGALTCGADWPFAYLAGLREYGPRETAANGATHFSWIPATTFALPAAIGPMVGKIGALLTLGVLAWSARGIPVDKPRFGAIFALWVTGTMLASPHLQYYDAGLLALPAVLGLEYLAGRDGTVPLAVRLGVAAVWLGYPLYELGPRLGVQPLALALVAAFAAVAALAWRDRVTSSA